MNTANNAQNSWLQSFLSQLKKQKSVATLLFATLTFVCWMLFASAANFFANEEARGLWLALVGASISFLATAVGAIPALFIRKMNARFSDSALGFAAGMMLAASAFSLLLPGIAAASELADNRFLGSLTVVFGMAIGVLLMLGIDAFTPHEHVKGDACGPGFERFNRVWLFVFAIILHNFPEGMAIGVAFSQGDLNVGIPLTTAIAIQDIPEGLVVALALQSAGIPSKKAILVAVLSGIVEPIGAVIGVILASGFAFAYPIGLGLAAGAMIFVVSHEVIPQTHKNGHQTPATIGLMAGFALMLMLDTALG